MADLRPPRSIRNPALRRSLARLRGEAHPGWAPVAVARLAGLEPAVGFPERGEVTTAECLVYRWAVGDPRRNAERVLREMARALLLRHGAPAGDREALELAIYLTGDVASLDLRPGLEVRLAALAGGVS